MTDEAPGQAMAADSYARGLHTKSPFPLKAEVRGKIVAVGQGRREDRNLTLIVPYTRVVLRHEIHELQVTDDENARPGETVQHTATLGFFQVECGGVLAWEDEVWIGDRMIGELVGFGLTHFPNHMNIFLRTRKRMSGMELGLKLGERVCLRQRE